MVELAGYVEAPLTGTLIAGRIASNQNGGATMTAGSYGDVLKAAHRLSRDAQVELAAALLRSVKSQPSRKARPASTAALEPLSGLSSGELSALAEAVVAPGKQASLQGLLEKNRTGALEPEEEAALDELLAQVDQVGLLKARAQYTLHLSRESGEWPE
ncbi:MAG TPA: hypothetical protein PK170_10925 [Anaerolineae bacterium]|nr:hypothetical protein [Anaerolineae bacterium]